jgi:transposase
MSLQPEGLPKIPEQSALVARAMFPQGRLPIQVRDRLAEVFADEPFAALFGVRGAPGMSPAVLSLVASRPFRFRSRPVLDRCWMVARFCRSRPRRRVPLRRVSR